MSTSIKKPPGLWTGQAFHFISLIILLIVVWQLWILINSPFPIAFWIAVFTPIAHQIFVWIYWRRNLAILSDQELPGFTSYIILFFILFGSRFASLVVLAFLDMGSLKLAASIQLALFLVLLIPGIYAMISVARYFGFDRAAGADHFKPEYRNMPPVTQGIFRYTSNGMYFYAFLLFWAIVIAFNSRSALIVTAFSHLYIWIHYFATEKPDMDFLYQSHSSN